MTSKIVVNNIEPDAGISTVSILGIATATKFIGDIEGGVTGNVTGNVTGSSGSCTGNAATATVASGITTTASVNTSGIVTATAFVPTTGQLSHRNIFINGAMTVAQRATSASSAGGGYLTLDRFKTYEDGLDENATQAQHTLTSSDTGPYAEGFRYSYHITNGNQTSGAGADDTIIVQTRQEAQDIANSGWSYTDPNSFITLSYWVKSSVSQTFYNLFRTMDGTAQMYNSPFALTANTWTKVTKTIPGNSNLQFDNDANNGFMSEWVLFRGTNDTTSDRASNAWAAFDTASRVPDMTSTWYTTNDATFEITGVQLEVGSVATPFEHRRFGEELLCCQRYYVEMGGGNYGDYAYMTGYMFNNGNSLAFGLYLPCAMRSTPTIAVTANLNVRESGSTVAANSPAIGGYDTNSNWIACSIGLVSDMGSNGDPATVTNTNNAGITLSAEI